MHNDFLFELGCEELPSGTVLPLSRELGENLKQALVKSELPFESIETFATPRRLAVLVHGLAETLPGKRMLRTGPPVASARDAAGNPTAALTGFARSAGVAVSDLMETETPKGRFMAVEITTPDQKVTALLPDMVREALANLTIPKAMRWGDGDVAFVRPVHWAVMLFGSEVLETPILGIQSGRDSRGHRFHHPESITITAPATWESQLLEAHVVASFEKRRARIVEQATALATTLHATPVMPEDLLDEVTSIVEWPRALIARFDPDFLKVPAEALIASMQAHQKCFALEDPQKNLLPAFVAVANIESRNEAQVIAGNERVMRARLSDAAFFFQQDQHVPLAERVNGTAQVVFEERLGSLSDKTERVRTLVRCLAPVLKLDSTHAERAVTLSKCDLLTGMVGEFPELQGLMGYYYALHDGEARDVAVALNAQYQPRFSGDALPASPLGMALSLADRLDTLAGIFAIGKRPTGVKDPYKLRRHALAVVRMLVQEPGPLRLDVLLREALTPMGAMVPDANASFEPLREFVLDRLMAWYQGAGVSAGMLHAVRAREENDLHAFDKRLKALQVFAGLPEAASLAAACKRVDNLLRQAMSDSMGDVMPELLQEPAEKSLFTAMTKVEQDVLPLYVAGDFERILRTLATLQVPVDAFFDQVMVMVEQDALRLNRLRLLGRLHTILTGVAAISLLPAA